MLLPGSKLAELFSGFSFIYQEPLYMFENFFSIRPSYWINFKFAIA